MVGVALWCLVSAWPRKTTTPLGRCTLAAEWFTTCATLVLLSSAMVLATNGTLLQQLGCSDTSDEDGTCSFSLVVAVIWMGVCVQGTRFVADQCRDVFVAMNICFAGIATTFQILAIIASGGVLYLLWSVMAAALGVLAVALCPLPRAIVCCFDARVAPAPLESRLRPPDSTVESSSVVVIRQP